MAHYYVWLINKEPLVVAKTEYDDKTRIVNSYIWKNGQWRSEPDVSYRVRNEISSFEEISEIEAKEYIQAMESRKNNEEENNNS